MVKFFVSVDSLFEESPVVMLYFKESPIVCNVTIKERQVVPLNLTCNQEHLIWSPLQRFKEIFFKPSIRNLKFITSIVRPVI